MIFREFNEKKLALYLIAGLMVAVSVAGIAGFKLDEESVPKVEEGLLDLTDWEFNKAGNIRLDGDWEFYWNRLVEYKDLGTDQPDLYGRVPSTWTGYSRDGEKFPGQGYATYRLRVVTDLEPGTKMGFKLSSFSTAFRIFVNQEEVAAEGVVAVNGQSSQPELRPQAVEFTVPAREFDIVVHVSNFHHGRGGFWYSLILGTSEDIAGLQNQLENRQVFITGILLFVALTYLCLFFLRRQSRDYLYMALMAIGLIIATDTTNQLLIHRFFPGLSFPWLVILWYGSATWVATLLALFTEELFPARYSKQLVRAWTGYTVLITLMFIFTPVSFYTGIVSILNIIDIFPFLLVFYLTIRAVGRNEHGSGLYLFGFTVAISTYVHDTLFLNNIISSELGELGYVGIIILFFIQTIVQAQRYTKSFQDKSRLLEKVQLANELKDEFMFNTSHQVLSPLSAIDTLADELLAESHGKLNIRQRDNLLQMKAFGDQVVSLVNDIYIYTKLKRREIDISLNAIDVRVVAENVIDVLRKVNHDSEVLLVCEVPDDIPPVLADENYLYQVIYNLVYNGIKSASGEMVALTAQARDDRVEVQVKDSGPGLAPDKISTLFEFFEDAIPAPARNKTSMGLDLPIARQLVELQGGEIWVENSETGSDFFFTLPVAKEKARSRVAPQLNIGQAAAVAESVYQVKDGRHVLVVDDSLDMLNAIVRVLEHSGYKTTALSDGSKVVEAVLKDPSISVVLLDVIMPERSGYDICRDIRKYKTPFDLPILILTAKTAVRDVVMGFDAGANDYLAKPFRKEELLARVRTLVNLKELVDKAIASEISFLQAQIKPHFLYNALSVIASLIKSKPQEARALIVSLSEYLRNSFDFASSDDMIPLEEELAMVDAYVRIERARFGARLDYQLIAEELPQVTVPRLVLQPLVENAIRHGIFAKPSGGTVKLIIEEEAGQVNFRVEDDGIGMSAQKINGLLTETEAQGVGLANINSRLLSYYGSGLSLQSLPDKGTTVSFSIAKQRGVG